MPVHNGSGITDVSNVEVFVFYEEAISGWTTAAVVTVLIEFINEMKLNPDTNTKHHG